MKRLEVEQVNRAAAVDISTLAFWAKRIATGPDEAAL